MSDDEELECLASQAFQDNRQYLHAVRQGSSAHGKTITDPIHGPIRLEANIVKLIDTMQFQRLRGLHQLGSASYVFPGAVHTRFEHSLGVSHLAGNLVDRFMGLQPELDITQHDRLIVRIAGLMHDLGHGCFSHVFDNEFLKKAKPGCTWTHEEGSVMMLEDLLTDNGIDFLGTDDVKYINNLITNKVPPRTNEKAFLYDIVSNKRNSVDVDKFDYIVRDSYFALGMHGGLSSFNYQRLLDFSRVVDNEICFHKKEADNVYEMFHSRYRLHRRVYNHVKGKAVEYMLCDALHLADEVLGISDMIDDPKEYVKLTDSILDIIMCSKDERLTESQDIIRRIRKRNLYKFCKEILIPPDRVNDCKVSERDIIAAAPNSGLRESDIIIHNCKLNYALKDKDPVRFVKFFDEYDGPAFEVPKEEISLLIPDRFEERWVRIFACDPSLEPVVSACFKTWVQGQGLHLRNFSNGSQSSNKRKRIV
mmetsp:Transcript_2349/g.4158  ORF Transcript_2349/g.4158 Transcript_2349/m.4158 type:complete len:478 (-) Transcript_2349:161-1594(-)